MLNSTIFKTVGKVILPFLYMFGFYIIIFGDLTPGGGFQGGIIFATGFFVEYLIRDGMKFDLKYFVRKEKQVFMLMIILTFISYVSKGHLFTNLFTDDYFEYKRFFLVLLNVVIGLKVALGGISIILSFLEEGEQ